VTGLVEKPLAASPDNAIMELESVSRTRWSDDSLIGIGDIREFFKLGRTAAYELTHRPEFPRPVLISPRCYRWWASEVNAFAATLRRERVRACTQRTSKPQVHHPATPPRRITGRIRAAHTRKETR
jgi:predicted DNA-binding transcriptional regulator AlpA